MRDDIQYILVLAWIAVACVLAAQSYTWLKFGVWPSGSPLAIWAYLNNWPLISQVNGRWVEDHGWELPYKYGAIYQFAKGWVGLSEIIYTALTVHVFVWASLFTALTGGFRDK